MHVVNLNSLKIAGQFQNKFLIAWKLIKKNLFFIKLCNTNDNYVLL